jgi:hypothetical protein
MYWLGEKFAILFGFHESSYDGMVERYEEYMKEQEEINKEKEAMKARAAGGIVLPPAETNPEMDSVVVVDENRSQQQHQAQPAPGSLYTQNKQGDGAFL